jgi:integrase
LARGPINRLSPAKVRHAKPGMHHDGGGLYLQVTVGTNGGLHRSWIFRFAVNGRDRQMGLGPLDIVGLAEARERAVDARRQRERGIDPLEARNAQRTQERLAGARVMTFDQCRDAYLAAHRAGWRNTKHASQWINTLSAYVSPIFGQLSVRAIDTALVMKALEPIWTAKPETAGRVRGRIERVLDWAKVRGFRDGENPARWRGHLDHLLPSRGKVQKVEHHAALPYDQMAAFMAELARRESVSALALRFVVLTAARTGEALGTRWDEIDLAAKVWTISGDRMKGGRPHRVPLSGDAIAILERMEKARQSDHVFPGERRATLSSMALLMLLRRMKALDLTVHGFRSTFRDWAAERTNFRGEIVEAALAHAVGDKVEAAYRRGDMLEHRRRLMEDWAAHCAQRPTELAGDTVVSMKRFPG